MKLVSLSHRFPTAEFTFGIQVGRALFRFDREKHERRLELSWAQNVSPHLVMLGIGRNGQLKAIALRRDDHQLAR